jgi:hypothetical protein
MRRTSVSRPHRLVCPACGYGALHPRGPLSRSAYYCESCWCSFGGATVGTLKQLAALPDAVGKHACEECAHPDDALSGRRDVLLPRLPIRGGAYYRIQPPRCREPYRRRRTKGVAGIGEIGGIGRAEQG